MTGVPRAPRPVWFVAGVLLVLVLVALFGDKGVLQLWRLRGEVDTLHREVQVLEAENERLSRAVAELRDDPAVIERIAREELGLVRPGERVLRFPKTKPDSGPVPGGASPTRPPGSP